MFELHKHGEERVNKIKINHGKEEYHRREKYCARHGWIDVFRIGGDVAWQTLHSKCGKPPLEHGAYLQVPKAMGATA